MPVLLGEALTAAEGMLAIAAAPSRRRCWPAKKPTAASARLSASSSSAVLAAAEVRGLLVELGIHEVRGRLARAVDPASDET